MGITELEKMDNVSVATYPNITLQKISRYLSGGFGLDFVDELVPSRLLDFGILTKGENEFNEEKSYPRKFAAHHHSLTANSFGVLADVRTGGLKRDLSHAFSLLKDWYSSFPDDPNDEKPNWVSDFSDFLYRDRVKVFKSVPMNPNAKANQSHDQGDGPFGHTINDDTGIITGPY